jgi:predicted negative regulator of RcsB-dependent stress response
LKHRMTQVFLLLLFLALGMPTLARMGQVGGLFSEARYLEAQQSLVNGGEGAQPGEENLWRIRLAQNPKQAEDLLRAGLQDRDIPQTTRVGMALQLAQIHFARGEFEKANTTLTPLLADNSLVLPGEVYLLAGLTQRTSGNHQAAREMLASVKPTDPAFGAARYYLGDISLEIGDSELAQRYFESGQKNVSKAEASRLKAGQWRALRANGKDLEANRLLRELRNDSQGCLALVEIGRVLQQEQDDDSARVAFAAKDIPDTVVSSPENNIGRYSLQVGAFSDRSLALEFKRRHQEQIPDLTITEVRDDRGQFLYKLRFGSFVNPAQARSEAQNQKRILGMNVIVVDLGAAVGSSR